MLTSFGSLFGEKNSSLDRRNAFIYKCPDSLGHKFQKVILTVPTSCSKCRKFIYGFSAWKCALCKLSSDTGCLSYINSKCVMAKTPTANHLKYSSQDTNQHKFIEVSFRRPTLCDHCGVYLLGFYKQGVECPLKEDGCGMKVHHDCEQLVCWPCTARPQVNEKIEYVNVLESDNLSKISIDKHFDLVRILGVGGFSTVYLAKLKTNQQEYAIKVLKKTNPTISADPSSVFTEMRVLHLGREFPFLTIVHCCFQDKQRLCFVMEYVRGKSLYHYIDEGKFDEEVTRFFGAEIALALIFLHEKKIIYRDLKSDNVILEPSGHIKLLDFGMSKELNKLTDNTTNTYCGTLGYISPEAMDGKPYGTSVDWWAFGVLLYEMLLGDKPYACESEESYEESVRNDKVIYPKTLSEEARNLLEGLLTVDPRNRLGCIVLNNLSEEILSHPFFVTEETINQWWRDIEDKKLCPPFIPKELNDYSNEQDDSRPCLSPVSEKMEIDQAEFNGFSFYSESFTTSACI